MRRRGTAFSVFESHSSRSITGRLRKEQVITWRAVDRHSVDHLARGNSAQKLLMGSLAHEFGKREINAVAARRHLLQHAVNAGTRGHTDAGIFFVSCGKNDRGLAVEDELVRSVVSCHLSEQPVRSAHGDSNCVENMKWQAAASTLTLIVRAWNENCSARKV